VSSLSKPLNAVPSGFLPNQSPSRILAEPVAVATRPVHRAVELVGAGLGHRVDVGAGGAGDGHVVVRQVDVDGLDGVHRHRLTPGRHVVAFQAKGVTGRDAVDGDGVEARVLAAGGDGARGAIDERHARVQAHVVLDVAVDRRQGLDVLPGDASFRETLVPAPMRVALNTSEPPATPTAVTVSSVVTVGCSAALTVLTWFRLRYTPSSVRAPSADLKVTVYGPPTRRPRALKRRRPRALKRPLPSVVTRETVPDSTWTMVTSTPAAGWPLGLVTRPPTPAEVLWAKAGAVASATTRPRVSLDIRSRRESVIGKPLKVGWRTADGPPWRNGTKR